MLRSPPPAALLPPPLLKKKRSACGHELHTAPTPHFQGTFFLAARARYKDLRRTFPSLGPHKKILNPPSYNENIHSVDAIKKMLS